MTDINKVTEFFSNDLFVKHCDIKINEAKEGYCECAMKTSQFHLNAGGVIQGGAIYTLADFTFAVAANCDGKMTVTESASINYLKAGKGEKLIARANKISSGKSTCLYRVEIFDEKNTLIAYMTATGFIKDIPMNFKEDGGKKI